MLYLMKVYRQQEIQDGGLKKGNALSLTVILKVTLYTPNIELYFTKKHDSNDYVHVYEVSESNIIDVYATQPQKNGNRYHNRQTGTLFYHRPHNRYTIHLNDNFDVLKGKPFNIVNMQMPTMRKHKYIDQLYVFVDCRCKCILLIYILIFLENHSLSYSSFAVSVCRMQLIVFL